MTVDIRWASPRLITSGLVVLQAVINVARHRADRVFRVLFMALVSDALPVSSIRQP